MSFPFRDATGNSFFISKEKIHHIVIRAPHQYEKKNVACNLKVRYSERIKLRLIVMNRLNIHCLVHCPQMEEKS